MGIKLHRGFESRPLRSLDAWEPAALAELYEWYVSAEPMLTNVIRDAALVPACANAGENLSRHFDLLHEALMRGRRTGGRARARVSGAIGHALSFGTWRSLVREQGLTAGEAVELMMALVAMAGNPRASRA